jgi:glutamine amidotransferase
MIAVLDYGIGNLRSAEKALEHLGAEVRMVTDPEDAVGARGVVLPGVGSFGACVRALRASRLDEVAHRAHDQQVPFLGVCVGFQMLFDDSEESPGEQGLGIFGGSVEKIPGTVRLPQIQWNVVDSTSTISAMLPASMSEQWMYFVHSYVPVPSVQDRSSIVGTAEYGSTLAVALEEGNTWGVQFHPEKSGRDGLALLSRFVSQCDRADTLLQGS